MNKESQREKTPRTPDEIRKNISELEEELEESIQYHQYEFLVGDRVSELNNPEDDDMIGFYDLRRMRFILKKLYEGYKLRLHHEIFGKYDVFMNSHGPCIFVKNADERVNSDTVLNFMCELPGEWYVKREDV